ncbi:helix-turn-helix domain-containing protein [Achromobacter aegrifaciens]
MATTTLFGKTLRKLRIERDETMMDMAAKLACSPSFLSSIETGRKPVPAGFVSKLGASYGLSEEFQQELQRQLEESAKVYRITPEAGDQALVAAFARRLDMLSDNDKQQIFDILNKD